MALDLVTLDEAKLRLRLFDSDTAQLPDVEMKIGQASEIVIDYIKRPDHGWTADTAPALIKAAVLEVLRNLFDGEDPLPPTVKNVLYRFRDPAIA